jgi:hypothetical protein
MSKTILPNNSHLQMSVNSIAMVEGMLKTAMSDLVKVSSSVDFFGSPAI